MPPVPTGPHRRAALVAAPVVLALAVAAGFAAGRTTTPDAEGPAAPSTAPSPAPPAATSAATETDLALANADLRRPESCEDLLASYVERGVAAVSAYGWETPMVLLDAAMPLSTAAQSGRAANGYQGPRTSRVSRNENGTNVQESGVDEPDVVKTDGELLVRVRDDVLELHDVTGEAPALVGELELEEVRGAEILLAGDRVVAIGRDRVEEELTRVLTVDVSEPSDPEVVDERVHDARLLEARLHGGPGGTVRLVLTPYLPDLDFVQPRRKRSWREAERMNRQVVRESEIGDWLPTTAGDPLVDCEDVAVPADDDAALGTVAVVSFGVDAPGAGRSSGVAAGGQIAYFSQERVYLAEQSSFGWCCWGFVTHGVPDRPTVVRVGRDDGASQVFAFALDGDETTYVASGEVEGSIADRWSMDSVDAVLRVAVGPTLRTDDANSVVTLREEGTELVEAGRLDGLGRREEIKSVRWFDDLAIVVTFRQVDPLHAVDLSDPGSPTLLGELKVPGFAEYLHPLGPRRMIGVGQDAGPRGRTRGAQAALFDVHDLTAPRQLDVATYPRGSQAGAGTDPRQFTWLPDRRTALTVVSKGWRGRVGWVSVLRVEGGELTNRMIRVEDGLEVADVRTVALPSGKVVLVTADGLSFLDL